MRVFGIGSEIVECLRIAQMIERHGEAFLRRVYTDREIAYCSSRRMATQHYAARWAGKQAVIHALAMSHLRRFPWRDLEIVTQLGGRTTVGLGGEYRVACIHLDIEQLELSIAHCRTHASGYAIAMTSDA